MGHKTDMRARESKEVPAVVIGRGKPVPVQIAPKPVEYAFPTKSRCPRCGSTNTTRTSAYRDIQYRQCRMPVCRHRFSVKGFPLA